MNQDPSFLHLQAELARLDVLLQRLVRRWQAAGQDPNDAFRGLYISDGEANALLNRPLASHWGGLASPSAQDEAWFTSAMEQAVEKVRSTSEMAQSQGQRLRLESLAQTFGLDAFDLDAFLICVAPSLDLRYERLYGYLQDDVTRKRPTVNLIIDLLCEAGPDRLLQLRHFDPEAPLFRQRLLERGPDQPGGRSPLLSQALLADESVVTWLLGRYQPHADLAGFTALKHPQAYTSPAATAPSIEDMQTSAAQVYAPDETPVIVFYGVDLAGQEAAASSLAAQANCPLLVVNLESAFALESAPHEQQIRLALRDARLIGAIPFLTGWDACLSDGMAPAALLAEVFAFPGPVILSGRAAWRAGGIDRQRNLVWQEFSVPVYAQRRALWTHYLQQASLPVSFDDLDLTSLAGQFLLTTGQIRDAVASAVDRVVQEGGRLGNAELFAAARLYSNPRLASLARKILPRYGWDDIVLPVDQRSLLLEIVNTVRQRPRVLDEWGIGRKLASSRGVTVLFAGQPGTGKTMAAEVIAIELGLDLFKIDLSTVVSKYIGETEKNLERIFNEAESSNAILFFDEADALFGKRSEVRDSHDRYANIEISYLLQRMEAYDGVTILATNLRANLDEAFTRRLQFAVDFPFPEEADRLRIWSTLFPPEVPRDTSVDLPLLARRFKLAGGNIRNIIVSAAYLASGDGGVVTMSHLLHGTRRELQKMGRLVGENDFFVE